MSARRSRENSIHAVMPGLVPGIHAVVSVPGAWMAGTIPGSSPGTAMTGDSRKVKFPWARSKPAVHRTRIGDE
jgi:hypothetical protein